MYIHEVNCILLLGCFVISSAVGLRGYEVKRILREIEGVELLDEVSRIAAATLRFSYMFLTPHFSSSIRASGALVHFLLKSPDVCHAGGDDSVRWHRLNAGWEPI